MTTEKEQEAFGFVIDRHKNAASENDIRTAFQRFMETADLAAASEMTTEVPPGDENSGRMDLYIHNTCIEFKKFIVRDGVPIPGYVSQLDGYLESLFRAGTGVRNGILTDGVNYFLRRIGEEKLPLLPHGAMRTFNQPGQVPLLRDYLHGIITAPAENITPTAENLERHFGSDSDVFRASNLLLQEAYDTHRNAPTIAVKRRLWQDLLQVALGKDAATAGDESDWLFIRHTYITSLVALIMQQQLLGDVELHASERPDDLLKGHILAEQSDLHGIIDADLFTWPTEVKESAYLREIARVVERFDWTQNPTEVAPTLYQNVITQEERKRLGEYYTPAGWPRKSRRPWLTLHWTSECWTRPAAVGHSLNSRQPDSQSCRENCPQRKKLRKLQENVVGIDIHPVAVQLAKATWVMAAAKTIRAAREETLTVAP